MLFGIVKFEVDLSYKQTFNVTDAVNFRIHQDSLILRSEVAKGFCFSFSRLDPQPNCLHAAPNRSPPVSEHYAANFCAKLA